MGYVNSGPEKPLNRIEQRARETSAKKENRLIFVALVGFARSGKDTIAALMPGYQRIAFADALKSDILRVFQDTIPAGYSTETWMKENKELLRPLLVEYGRAKRAFNPNYWIERVAREQMLLGWTKGRFVFTDVRYPNEVAWLVSMLGARVFRIWREGVQAANGEEMESISLILNGRPEIETIYNPEGRPEEAAQRILDTVDPPPATEPKLGKKARMRLVEEMKW